MSVVSSGVVLFCEGKESSLDYLLLNKILETIPDNRCVIVPSGGKFGASSFAQGYFAGNMSEIPYLVFRDRDFDAQPNSTEQLLQLNNRTGKRSPFLTYRSCIENYLLEAELIHRYWMEKYQQKQDNPSAKWGHGASPGTGTIEQWIEKSARQLQFYQAVRWSLGALLRTDSVRKQLKTTWTGGSGKLPLSLGLEECRQEALRLITEFRQAVASVTSEKFEEGLGQYQELFGQQQFWEQRQYLIWFHGKDLQKEMQRQKSNYISLSSFFSWAISRLDIDQHQDLIELKTKIENM